VNTKRKAKPSLAARMVVLDNLLDRVEGILQGAQMAPEGSVHPAVMRYLDMAHAGVTEAMEVIRQMRVGDEVYYDPFPWDDVYEKAGLPRPEHWPLPTG
jgi:hypothetical protein